MDGYETGGGRERRGGHPVVPLEPSGEGRDGRVGGSLSQLAAHQS